MSLFPGITSYTLSHLQTPFGTFAADDFWKRLNCRRKINLLFQTLSLDLLFGCVAKKMLRILSVLFVGMVFYAVCTLSHKQTLSEASVVATFENIVNFVSNYTFIYRDIPCFCQDVLKVVCYRFVVSGKG